MDFNKSLCLISTFHDPIGDISCIFLQKHFEKITKIFDFISLAITDKTSDKLISFLNINKINYVVTKTGFGSKSRRIALKNGLKQNADYFFYIDLDRLLFWLEKYPQELIELLGKIKNLNENEYLVIGRTKKAWDSHPIWQQNPEEKTNKAISKEIGKKIDVTPGCRAFSRKIALIIDKKAKGDKSGVSDIEWLIIAKLYANTKISPIFIDGLSYETKLIFGNKRAQKPKGEYNITRRELADETIKMIKEVKNKIINFSDQ